jgi:hypothetical protein
MVSVAAGEFAEAPLDTTMETLAGLAKLPAGTVAVHTVDEHVAPLRAEPFHNTEEVVRKFVPLTVRVNDGAVAEVAVGEIVVIVGPRMVNVTALETPGPGFATVTETVPGEASRSLVIVAVSLLPLTNVVTSGVAPNLTVDAGT